MTPNVGSSGPVTPSVLRFVVNATSGPREVLSRFNPGGQPVVNRTAWRGKGPRSCRVTAVRGRPFTAGGAEPMVFDVEVSHRPEGYISFLGGTRYDGWTATLLDRQQDGTLLDGRGQPLAEGGDPVYLKFRVYEDAEFNEIDFGEFVGEFPVEAVERVSLDRVHELFMQSGRVNASVRSSFTASRRHRPAVKIVLSNAPSGTSADGFGTRIVIVNVKTPHLDRVILDEVTELFGGFVEGRYAIPGMTNDDLVFADLDHVLVDCTPNERGEESRFDCARDYLPEPVLDDLAKRLMATYEVDVSVVTGTGTGLLFKRTSDRA